MASITTSTVQTTSWNMTVSSTMCWCYFLKVSKTSVIAKPQSYCLLLVLLDLWHYLIYWPPIQVSWNVTSELCGLVSGDFFITNFILCGVFFHSLLFFLKHSWGSLPSVPWWLHLFIQHWLLPIWLVNPWYKLHLLSQALDTGFRLPIRLSAWSQNWCLSPRHFYFSLT